MNIIAYVLFILQAISFVGWMSSGYGWFVNFTEMLMGLTFFNGVPGFFYVLGRFLPLFLGCFFMHLHKKKLRKKNPVFFCENCKGIYEGPSGASIGCPICHKPTVEKDILWIEWKKMAEEEQKAKQDIWYSEK